MWRRVRRRDSFRAHWLAGCLISFLVLAGGSGASAQSDPAHREVSGIVLDSTGGVVSRATVAIRHDASGLQRVVETASDGTFSLVAIAQGRYRLTVSADGFAAVTQVVDAPSTARLTFTLTPAPIVE